MCYGAFFLVRWFVIMLENVQLNMYICGGGYEILCEAARRWGSLCNICELLFYKERCGSGRGLCIVNMWCTLTHKHTEFILMNIFPMRLHCGGKIFGVYLVCVFFKRVISTIKSFNCEYSKFKKIIIHSLYIYEYISFAFHFVQVMWINEIK